MHPVRQPVATVDEYLDLFKGEAREHLEQIRMLITQLVPEADQSITYAIPTYKIQKHRIIYFAGYDKHVSLYPLPKSAPDSFMQEMEQYKAGKGTVHFVHNKPLPIDFITEFIKYRVQDGLQGK